MNGNTILIVGGGSTWTPGILKSLLKQTDILPIKKVILYDINAERQRIIGEFAKVLFAEEAPNINFFYTTNPEEAFPNVDFVLCQIRSGGYEMRELDEKIPLKYGVIGQETCGPGGFAYGLRSISQMVALVKAIRKKSPEAWIINYTNPAAIVALALQHYFPHDKKMLNICDQPVNLLRSYAKLINVPRQSLEPRYFGLNHFGWFTAIYDAHGSDVMPKIKDHITEHGFLPVDAEQRDASWLETYALVQDMLIDFPEFLPNTYLQYYLYPHYKVKQLNPSFTRANEVQSGREKKVFSLCKKIAETGSTKGLSVVHNDAHGDMIVEIVASIANNSHKTFIVIVPNDGVVANLDCDVMIEAAATVGSNGPSPYAVGPIKTFYKGLIEQQHAFEKLTVSAYINESYNLALQALTLNRAVVDAKLARTILDELIEVNKNFWPRLV